MTEIKRHLVIAIDGPAGSGKTTVSQELSKMLGFTCINTGNMFRGVALLALGTNREEAAIEIAQKAEFEFVLCDWHRTIMNGTDITRDISSPDIISSTSRIAEIEQVRRALLLKQRDLARAGGVVMEGRDIGTKVLPRADWKFFLDADEDVRLDRLYNLMDSQGRRNYPTKDSFRSALRDIDRRDRERTDSPLRRPPDALCHKTSLLAARDEAAILYYYVANSGEILENMAILKERL